MKALKPDLHSHRRKSRGFTLIEVMIGLFVFTVGVLAAMTMTINSISSFTRARTSSTEVNRTTLNLETLKQVGYRNNVIFRGVTWTPMGSDGAYVEYTDTNDFVMVDTKLIEINDTKIKGFGPGGIYHLSYIKPLVDP